MHEILRVMVTPTQRLGTLVQERREALGIYTVVDAASRSGLSRETWAKVERGDPAAPVTYRKIEALLQWEPGSAGLVLNGGDPVARPARGALEGSTVAMDKEELLELRRALAAALERIDRIQRDAG